MTIKTKCVLSKTYLQLSTIFEALEIAAFTEGADFGENLTQCYQWFISPEAVTYLEKRFPNDWASLQNNGRFSCFPVPWQGYKGLGFSINLNL